MHGSTGCGRTFIIPKHLETDVFFIVAPNIEMNSILHGNIQFGSAGKGHTLIKQNIGRRDNNDLFRVHHTVNFCACEFVARVKHKL